jgi:hypothetical protein
LKYDNSKRKSPDFNLNIQIQIQFQHFQSYPIRLVKNDLFFGYFIKTKKLQIMIRFYLILCLSLFGFLALAQPGGCDQSRIDGTWALVREDDGSTPKAGASVTLKLAHGKAWLEAKMPSQTATSDGNYSACGGIITIEFDDFDFGCSLQFYKLEGNTLTLPFVVLGNGKNSIWKRGDTNSSNQSEKTDDDGTGDDNKDKDGNPDDDSDGDGQNDDDKDDSGDPNDDPDGRKGTSKWPFDESKGGAAKYAGKWVGTAWGWEVRFKHTAGDFVSQFTGVNKNELPMQGDKVIMTLTVEHTASLDLDIDENGNVTGEGVIVYNLIPNLCGVAALTTEVNFAVGMLEKIDFIYKLGKELGQTAINDFRIENSFLEDQLWKALSMAKSTTDAFVMDALGNKFAELAKGQETNKIKSEILCGCAAGNPLMAAGTKMGPSTLQELMQSVGGDLSKAILFDALGKSMPVGMLLSIPGVTQVQYQYKGLVNGPEKRNFKVKGFVDDDGIMRLNFGGLVDGSSNLNIQYTVNYQTDKSSFPVWSPFTAGSTRIKPYGEIETVVAKDEIIDAPYTDPDTGAKKTTKVTKRNVVTEKATIDIPFAAFRESGKNRGGKTVWHEYEYNWKVFRVPPH